MEGTYTAATGAARLVLRALGLRIDLLGDEQVPVSGPVLLVSNHVSFLDFVLVGLAARRSSRRVRFLTRYDVWRHPLVGRAMTAMGHVPVDRAAPAGAYLHARALLRRGEAVGVFPEAGISLSWTVRGLLPGAVALAADTGAPIVPVTIWGPQRVATALRRPDLRRGRPVSISVGAPYTVAPDADRTAELHRLGGRLQRMLDELQERPEHQPPAGEEPWWHPAHLGGGAPTPLDARARERTVHPRAVPPSWAPPA